MSLNANRNQTRRSYNRRADNQELEFSRRVYRAGLAEEANEYDDYDFDFSDFDELYGEGSEPLTEREAEAVRNMLLGSEDREPMPMLQERMI